MFSYEETIELLERAVAERGEDYIYDPGRDFNGEKRMCRYVEHDGTPGCIVGQVLSYVNMLDGFTFETEGTPIAHGVVQNNFDQAAINALGDTQMRQDCGDPWGVALAYAKDCHARGVKEGRYEETTA